MGPCGAGARSSAGRGGAKRGQGLAARLDVLIPRDTSSPGTRGLGE